MLILIDAGNTTITFGLARNNKIIRAWHVPSAGLKKQNQAARVLKKNLAAAGVSAAQIKAVVLCSVVPRMNAEVFRKIRTVCPQATERQIGKNLPLPIKNKYRYPSQVGQDRLVNALAAGELYGLPAIIVDFGTAITIDVVTAGREYIGGVICPGISLSLRALYERAELLPDIRPRRPRGFPPTDTENSMLSGVILGAGFLVDGFIALFKRMDKCRGIVIGTGGESQFMKKYCRNIDKIDPLLTLKGIEIAYNLIKK